MPTVFSIGAIKINSLDHNASVNFGENILFGNSSVHYNAQGSGGSIGDGLFEPSVGSVAIDPVNEFGSVRTTNPLAEGVNV